MVGLELPMGSDILTNFTHLLHYSDLHAVAPVFVLLNTQHRDRPVVPTIESRSLFLLTPFSETQPMGDSEHVSLVHNRLHSVSAELRLNIMEYLDWLDIVHVSAASRSLRDSLPDPHTYLNDELAAAWVETQRTFGNQIHLDLQMNLLGSTVNGKTVHQRVQDHAVSRGFSRIVVRWLTNPVDHKFACSTCRKVKPWEKMSSEGLRQLYPFRMYLDPGASRLKYKEVLDSLECGKCFAERHPRFYHHIGLRDKETLIIKCDICLLMKKALPKLPFKLLFSGFCEECFREVNQDWFKYKNFLQDCLTRMEEYEQAKTAASLNWKGLPACPVPHEFTAHLAQGDSKPLFDYVQLAFAQISERVAQLEIS